MREDIKKALSKFINAHSHALHQDARVEYLDMGERRAKKAWEAYEVAEAEFRQLLETIQ